MLVDLCPRAAVMLTRWLPLEETVQVFFDGEAGRDGVQRRVRFDLGGVEVQILSPYQPRLYAHLYDLLEEAPEDAEAEALARASEVGVVGQRLVKVVAQVPTHREAVGRHTHKLPLGAQTLEEKNELQAEKDHRIHRRPAATSVQGTHQVPDE